MEVNDFDFLLNKINNAVFKIVEIFSTRVILNLKDAKNEIRNVYVGDVNQYQDYTSDSFDLIQMLLTAKENNDISEFYRLFLFSTFLAVKILKTDDSDVDRIEKVNKVLEDFYNDFIPRTYIKKVNRQ